MAGITTILGHLMRAPEGLSITAYAVSGGDLGLELFDSVAFGSQTGISHRVDRRYSGQRACVVARALGTRAEREGRALVVELVLVR